MHQPISYNGQFEPWKPNYAVDNVQSSGLDFYCLLIYHHGQEENFEKVMVLDDKLVCSGLVNSYLHAFMFNAQREYNKER